MEIAVTISGDREVALKFEQFPQRAHASLLSRITNLTTQLEARVRAAEPSLTGKLRGETVSHVYDDPERIRGVVTVSADFAKAGALEYGAHRATRVKEHYERLGHVFARLISPLAVVVSEHTRIPNIQEHAFLRGPLAEMEPEVVEQLKAALVEAIGA